RTRRSSLSRPRFVVIWLVICIGAFRTPGHAEPSPLSTPSASATPRSSQSAQGAPQPTPSPTQETRLKTIVVTATRVAQPIEKIGTTVTVVPDRQMQSQKIQSVGTALQQVPGLTVT